MDTNPSSQNTADPKADDGRPDPKAVSAGHKAAAVFVLVLATLVSAVPPFLTPNENRSYWMGRIVGAAIMPLLLAVALIGISSIFKRFRSAKSRYDILVLLGTIVLLSQCSTALKSLRDMKKEAPVQVEAPLTESLTPADLEDIRAVCAAFEAGVRKGDISAFQKHMDRRALFDRAAAGLSLKQSSADGTRRGVMDVDVVSLVTGPLIQSISEGTGDFALLRVRDAATEARALFRARMDGGLNYHEWIFEKAPGASPRIVDINVFTSGELFSKTLRRTLVLPLVDGLDEAESKKILGLSEKIRNIGVAAQEKRPLDAKQIFDAMPKDEQDNKLTQLAYINAASQLGDETYLAAQAHFIALFPNDPGLMLLSIDYYILKKNYDAAIAQIDRLDVIVEDPALNGLRANLHFLKEDFAAAETAARRALESGERTEDVHWSLLGSLVYQQKFDEAVVVLEEMKTAFDTAIDEEVEDPAYQKFLKSKAYRKWKRTIV